jgi:hypothetical protein
VSSKYGAVTDELVNLFHGLRLEDSKILLSKMVLITFFADDLRVRMTGKLCLGGWGRFIGVGRYIPHEENLT